MTTDIHDKAAVEEKLWKEIADTKFGMIAPAGGTEHFQPMTTFAEPETGKLWFYTSDQTDLARSAAARVATPSTSCPPKTASCRPRSRAD